MALISCPECKKGVSDTSDRCPNCGFQLLVPAPEMLPPSEEASDLPRGLTPDKVAYDAAGNLVKLESRVHFPQLNLSGMVTYVERDRIYIKYDEVVFTKEQFKKYFNRL